MPSRWNSQCTKCLIDKHLTNFPETASEAARLAYMDQVFSLLTSVDPEKSAPVLSDQLLRLQKDMFDQFRDYTEIKQHFNQLMLDQEDWIQAEITAAPDPILRAVQYVMKGNYIDFGILSHVDNQELMNLLSQASSQPVDEATYQALLQDLASARRMVLLTDNCGEIVLDKLLLKAIKKQFPELSIQIIVRGGQAMNDATMEDAIQTGLTEIAPVIGNGTTIPGTYLPAISAEARALIEQADVILSKGQGNFESLQQCGLNIYYMFLCKCELFTKRFHTKLYDGILINDRDVTA